MKKRNFIAIIFLLLALLISIPSNVAFADDNGTNKVYLGGMPAGFTVYNRGAYVNGFRSVITENGVLTPCKDCGMKIGDLILSINNIETNSALDVEKALTNTDEKILTVSRNNEILYFNVKPCIDIYGKIKLGLFIREGINGIGTITYIKGNRFASLGHPIIDENNNIVEITGGDLYNCKITGIIKGVKGRAGELRGVISRDCLIGRIDKNQINGVFGKINDNFDKSTLQEIELGSAKVGDAEIRCTIANNKTSNYKVSIVKIEKNKEIKNLVIKIEDEELIENAGGIIQGLSGSPIIQEGKLIGAVTHVFINDPSRGFGILIDKMNNN